MPLLFTLLAGVIPFAIDAVKHIETFFKGQKVTGETKRQAAVGIVGDALESLGAASGVNVSAQTTEVQSAIGQLVDGIVSVMNATGVFTHAAATAAAKPAA